MPFLGERVTVKGLCAHLSGYREILGEINPTICQNDREKIEFERNFVAQRLSIKGTVGSKNYLLDETQCYGGNISMNKSELAGILAKKM